MVEVDDLGGTREVLPSEGPNPGRTIAKDDDLLGTSDAAPNGLGEDPRSELLGCFDGADVAG